MSPTLTDAGAARIPDGLAVLESRGSTAETFGIPLAVLAELTHRCPLQCPYCSNPVELDRGGSELTTEEWKKVLTELAEIGVLQIHFSGGEPTARKDLVELVQHASDVGLYSNLITSAVLLTRDKLAGAGRCRACVMCRSAFRATSPCCRPRRRPEECAWKKLEVARWTRELDLPLTVNAVMHRQNLYQLADIIQMAVDLDADRLEVANVQYYGWALKNRAALMPTLEQIEETSRIVEEAAGAAERHPGHRLRGARLLRAAAEEMHGRLGPAVLQHFAVRQGAALPRRRNHHRARIRIGAQQSFDRLDLAELRAFNAIAAPAGCRSRAGAASSRKSISAAAAARPSPPWRPGP